MRLFSLLLCMLLTAFPLQGEGLTNGFTRDTLLSVTTDSTVFPAPSRLQLRSFLLPTTLVAVGTLGVTSGWMRQQNEQFAQQITPQGMRKNKIDDYTRFIPLMGVYALPLIGLRPHHDLRDRLLLTATTTLLYGAATWSIKQLVHHPRPDASDAHSFPSGHTAFAFAGAEMLRQEYSHTAPWVGIAGYGIAVGTAFLRTYNHKHWLTDVVAGAGIGIATTRLAYWLLPWQRKWLKWEQKKSTTIIIPYASAQGVGVHCALYL